MRLSNKKLGLSKQLENDEFHHHITVRYNSKKHVDAVKNFASDAGNVLATVAQAGYDVSIGLGATVLKKIDENILNNNLDLYTGGLISDAKNAGNFLGDLGKGHEVETNLKSGARVGVVAGVTVASGGTSATAIGTTALITSQSTQGLSQGSWQDILQTAGNALPIPDFAKKLGNDIFSSLQPQGNQWYADSSPNLILNDTKGKFIPIIIISTIVVGGIILITAKKKRNKK